MKKNKYINHMQQRCICATDEQVTLNIELGMAAIRTLKVAPIDDKIKECHLRRYGHV